MCVSVFVLFVGGGALTSIERQLQEWNNSQGVQPGLVASLNLHFLYWVLRVVQFVK